MTTTPDPVGGNGNPSGNADDQNDEQKPSYESFQKAVAEKKAAQERARKLEEENAAFKKEREDLQRKAEDDERKRLEDKEQFKDLYHKVKEELAKKESALNEMTQAQLNARKMSSFLEAIKGDIPRQYWGLIDIDKIQLDGEKVDEFSVQKYVEEFRETYKDVIKPRDSRRMPIDSPPADDSALFLTYEQWLKLPAKEKESKINLVK